MHRGGGRRHSRSLLSLAAVLLIFVARAPGAYLRNIPQIVRQPDGGVLACLASGDEYYNWLHDAAGYTIVQDEKTGWYVFAVPDAEGGLKPSSLVPGRDDPSLYGLAKGLRLAPKKILESRQEFIRLQAEAGPVMTPRTGALNNLVVFIRFSGEGEFSDAPSAFTGLLNASGAADSSLYNYFHEASYGALSVTSSLYPAPAATILSYQDSRQRGYYQPYNEGTNAIGYTGGDNGTERRNREHALLRDAVAAIASGVPSGLVIDGDADGYVDNIVFVISGSPTGWSSLLWPHMWSLYSQVAYINGKRVYTYNFQLRTTVDVGVLCHEMFHSLGSPDLYHYTSNGIQPVGGWDIMENDRDPPQHMGAYMKWRYGGWIASLPEIVATGTYSLNPLTSPTGNCFKIRSPNSTTEYFVVEYRKRIGVFESSVPGDGLLVYRINTAASGNAYGPPDEVYIYRPDGTPTVNGQVSSAAFSLGSGRTAINDSTNPSGFLSSGGAGGLSIYGIGSAGTTIAFSLTIPGSAALTLTSPNGGETWAGGTSHAVAWTTTGTVSNVKLEYSANNGATWTTITGSTANTGSYAWTVPSLSSAGCLVRVSDAAVGFPADTSDAAFTITGDSPAIGLSHSLVNFGAIRNGAVTPAEKVNVFNAGKGTLSWTAVSSAAWLSVSPGSGTNSGVLTIGIAQTNLSPGTYQGTITLSASGVFNSPQILSVCFRVYAADGDAAPFGAFDLPEEGATIRSSVAVTGWALDDIGMQSVKIYRGTSSADRVFIGDAVFVPGARPDVESAYPNYPQNRRAGWGYMMLTNFLPNGGNGDFTLLAYGTDLTGHEVLLGTKAVFVDNASAVLPFGAIDTPPQGGTASGSGYYNFGWALTPQPNSIPTSGSTIWVWVDGYPLGNPSYNNYRGDIATLFPGYANAGGAVGFYILNTTAYVDGFHTIAWSVTDSAGNVDGIGSRYFTIQNAPGAPGAADAETVLAFDAISGMVEDFRTGLFVRQGPNPDAPGETIYPDAGGSRRISLRAGDPLTVSWDEIGAPEDGEAADKPGDNRFVAYEIVGLQLRPLPVGSSFDARAGVFRWMPGPGFYGEYKIVLADRVTMTKKTISVVIK